MAKFEICIGNMIGFESYSDGREFKSTIESQFGKSYDIDGIEFEYKYFESDNEDYQMNWEASGVRSRVDRAARKLFSKIKPVWQKEEAKYDRWEENEIFLDVDEIEDRPNKKRTWYYSDIDYSAEIKFREQLDVRDLKRVSRELNGRTYDVDGYSFRLGDIQYANQDHDTILFRLYCTFDEEKSESETDKLESPAKRAAREAARDIAGAVDVEVDQLLVTDGISLGLSKTVSRIGESFMTIYAAKKLIESAGMKLVRNTKK
jgi:hypothetical protein